MNIVVSTLNAKYIHTNLAMRYLKAYAQPEFNLEMVEYTIKDPILHIVTDLHKRKPDVALFSCYIWNVEQTLEIITLLKKVLPEVITVVGGPEVSYDMKELLTAVPALDFIITGEGEATVKHLLTEIKGSKAFDKVEGIAFRKGDEVSITPRRPYLDLNKIPSPFRFPEDIPNLSKRITYIETSRGCPFSCQFCLSSIEKGIRFFDVERMKDELRFLMNNGARVIKFLDRTFNTNRQYALDMFQFLIDEHTPGTIFQFEITADIMHPDVIQFLNDYAPSGLFRFEIGVQSTNDETNILVNRKQNFEKLANIVTLIKNGGKIEQHLDLIAGLPREDYASFRKTFNDVFALWPEELQLGFLKMLRGTGVRNRADDHAYVFMDKPPYEILKNDVLSFEDVVKIKQVEDVLEKYWNAHRMDYTVTYLVTHSFKTPFDFFQSFGTYWEMRGWSRIGHQLEDLFNRLYQFLENQKVDDLDVIMGLMKLDYLRHQKYKPRKVWWDEKISKTVYSAYFEKILENPNLLGENFKKLEMTQKEIFKQTVFEIIPFDYNQFVIDGTIIKENHMILSYHDGKTVPCSIFSTALKKLQDYIS